MSDRTVIGVDPGLKGGLAVIDGRGELLELADMPLRRVGKRKEIDGAERAAFFGRFAPAQVIVEAVHSMPRQGVASTFAFGRGVGIVLGVLQAMGLPFAEVSPQAWQKLTKCTPGEGKERTLRWAAELFHGAELWTRRGRGIDGRADALGLAWYGWLSMQIDDARKKERRESDGFNSEAANFHRGLSGQRHASGSERRIQLKDGLLDRA